MLAIFYWILMLFILLCSGWMGYRPENRMWGGFGLLTFLLLLIIGFRLFPVHW